MSAQPRSICQLFPSLLLVGLALACGGSEVAPEGDSVAGTGDASPAVSELPGPAGRSARVLFLGDSLTAGYGLDQSQAFPTLVSAALEERGLDVEVVNAGVSGDTTSGGLARLDWLLRQDPDVVMVALGANDGLRGLPVAETEANLRRIIERSQESGAAVILGGMLLPPNYGPSYVRAFGDIYPRLARELEIPLIPFLLDGVAANPALNLGDGIHPNAEGQRIVAATVLPYVEEALLD